MVRLASRLLILLAATAGAALLYVEPGEEIQAALDSCGACDTVLVAPGTYFENLVWPNTQSIKLLSEHGPDTTIIDGDSAGSVVVCSTQVDTTTWIEGFTIRNGLSSGSLLGGGGICCLSSSPTIARNVIVDNRTPEGGYGGGGILALTGACPHIVDNTVSRNQSNYSGGILCADNAHAVISGNTLESNIGDNGGAIGAKYGSHPTIHGNLIQYDSARWGAGICIQSGSCPLVTYDTIRYCVVDRAGSGIYTQNPNTAPVIRHCLISENRTPESRGAVLCDEGSVPDIDSCTISYNDKAGVVAGEGALPTVNDCDIFGNGEFGVLHVTSGLDTLDARHNWWGHATGPFHTVLNPAGLGDTVSDYVLFEPWDTIPPQGIAEPGRTAAPARRLASTFVRSVIALAPWDKAELLNIAGRKVADLVPGPNDIRHLSPGVYFVHQPTADGKQLTTVRKVIITR